jgi:phosphatidylglycerophosphate synthase
MLADTGRDLVAQALEPLAARLPNVSPNAVTAAGFVVSILGGTAYYFTDRSPTFFLVAAGLAIAYGFLDAFDGVLARVHCKESPWGDFLDHALDRLSAMVALAGLTLTEHLDDRLGLLLMLGTLYHGFLGTQLEASFGGRVYRGLGIAEALLFNLVYNVTAYAIAVYGLPFWYREPWTGRVLSVSDTFALACFPLLAIGICQRFWIARELARGARKA